MEVDNFPDDKRPSHWLDLVSRPADLAGMEGQRDYDSVMHCNRCGFCTSFCPTYLATGDEGLSPRGRNQAWRALLEGRISAEDGQRLFDTCLLCGICTSVCFAQVPTAKLMPKARAKVREVKGTPWPLRLVLRGILPRPGLFEPLLKAAYVGKRLGITGLLNRLGLLRLVHARLAAAEELVERAPRRFLRESVPPAAADAQVVQFLACGPNCLTPEVGLATAHLLKVSGVKTGSAGNVCCGLPGQSFGDLEAARRMARANIEILEGYPHAIVLVDDSSCAAAVKDWPRLFEDDLPWRARAEAVSHRTRDLLQWLDENAIKFRNETSESGPVVTYHDACKARYGQGLVEEPRRLLRNEGVNFTELPEADQCCGGGGTYQFMQPAISRAVGERKTQNILATGAQVVLTSSVSCLLQLRAGLRRARSQVRALHIAEFLAARLSKRKDSF